MIYRLVNLSEDAFEEMINTICHNILGTGVVSFTKGVDGGRDGKFTGTANKYPDEKNPWTGKFIIQAKHTTNPIASCSDNDFFKNKTSTINKEIKSIKSLVVSGDVENYLLFTNRKATGSTESEIVKKIQQDIGLKNVALIGVETISTYLSQNKDIVKQFSLDKFSMPFEFYDKDIKDVISIFYKNIKTIKLVLPIKFINKDIKNELNNLDNAYFTNVIKRDALKYFKQIEDFLSDPKNETLANYYEQTASELNAKIEIKRADFEKYEEIFDFIFQYVFEKNTQEIKDHRNLILVFLHHMYYNCHIGRTE